MIPVYKPFLPTQSLRYAHDAIDSGWISYLGRYKSEAAAALSQLMDIKYVLLTMNGTAACHLMSRALMRFHPEVKRIIVPNNVYVAAWNTFLFDGRYDLIPIEPDYSTWNMDETLLPGQIPSDTALLVCHNIGSVVNVPSLRRRFPETVILEDNCEGFGGRYDGSSTGTSALCSSISFFGNKNITCGEGGAFTTNDKDLFLYAKKIHEQGQSDVRYIHDELGYNYRMTNVQAALLLGQIEVFAEVTERKRAIFDKYSCALSSIPGVELQGSTENTKHANWMFGIRFKNARASSETCRYFADHDVDIRPLFAPITAHAHLRHLQCDVTVATALSQQCVMLPSYPELSEDAFEQIISTARSYSRWLK